MRGTLIIVNFSGLVNRGKYFVAAPQYLYSKSAPGQGLSTIGSKVVSTGQPLIRGCVFRSGHERWKNQKHGESITGGERNKVVESKCSDKVDNFQDVNILSILLIFEELSRVVQNFGRQPKI